MVILGEVEKVLRTIRHVQVNGEGCEGYTLMKGKNGKV